MIELSRKKINVCFCGLLFFFVCFVLGFFLKMNIFSRSIWVWGRSLLIFWQRKNIKLPALSLKKSTTYSLSVNLSVTTHSNISVFSEVSIWFFQGYQARGGKKTCWFLGCCIHGVLSQGEWGIDISSVQSTHYVWHRFTQWWPYSCNADCCGGFQADHFGDGESWWKCTPRGEEVRCDVKKCIQDINELICWRQEAQLHQLANRDLATTKTLQWNFSAPLW